jgi:hypothetical protein
MSAAESTQSRARKAPTAQCRLCSAVAVIDAPTTDQLRISLRRFMADHRHDGLADIVIDISDEADAEADSHDVVMAEKAGVSPS